MNEPGLYGVALEFDSPAQLVEAAKAVRHKGFRRFEAYSPYPVKDLDDIVPGSDPVPRMVLTGGIIGGITALSLEYYIAVVDYPINVGGRPLNSWPAFIAITFELTVLFASVMAFLGTLWLAGLPLLHHPVFNLKEFARASSDRFFLFVEASDPVFQSAEVRESLRDLGALQVWEIEGDE